mmetsp:Transcript_15020/g.24849  ORF Transcript_15020/g.24849 Transcript_15020/m.24849 type:complete len:285 (+) Transcript_15020:121-975(+)
MHWLLLLLLHNVVGRLGCYWLLLLLLLLPGSGWSSRYRWWRRVCHRWLLLLLHLQDCKLSTSSCLCLHCHGTIGIWIVRYSCRSRSRCCCLGSNGHTGWCDWIHTHGSLHGSSSCLLEVGHGGHTGTRLHGRIGRCTICGCWNDRHSNTVLLLLLLQWWNGSTGIHRLSSCTSSSRWKTLTFENSLRCNCLRLSLLNNISIGWSSRVVHLICCCCCRRDGWVILLLLLLLHDWLLMLLLLLMHNHVFWWHLLLLMLLLLLWSYYLLYLLYLLLLLLHLTRFNSS